DAFKFSVNDGTDNSIEKTLTVDVTADNHAPITADKTITINEDTDHIFSASDFNFTDVDGDTLASIKITILETIGNLKLNGVDVTLNQSITKADIDAGKLKFTPVANANGTGYDSLGFSVNDGTIDSSTKTITIDITATNDAPTIASTTASQDVNDNATISPFSSVTIADADNPAQIQTVSITLDTALKGNFTTLNGFTDATGGVYTFNGTAAATQTAIQGLVFTPTANRVSSGSTETTTFTISVNDGVATAVTNNTTTVVSTSINDAPTTTDKTITTDEDTDHTFSTSDFSFTDSDTDASLASIKITTLEAFGSLKLDGADVTTGQVINKLDIENGKLKFTPATDANGTAYDTFKFKVNDGIAGSAEKTLTVNVNAVNDTPVGVPTISGVVTQNETLTVNTSNITDLDGMGNFSYQWQANSSAISGQTSSTYILSQTDVGKTIGVELSYTDDDGTLET
ncbi:MAG: cadherin-like domain-containing protein, partial [Methylococcales bacterium]|nr:cadherin-like domain-containing protein [Methylococcales bacterium]